MVAPLQTQLADPLIGTLLADKYRIEEKLGQGGMGVVYRATHVGLAHTVAIKILLGPLSADRRVAERFAREARIIARLDSAHIVRVLDAGNDEPVGSYIVMEYLNGENLGDRIERTGALGLAQSVSYVLQAISGLEQAHKKGIVHRDLKPENLFLARNAQGTEIVKVLDFGISKQSGPAASNLTQSQVLLGSPCYMAPEQVMSLPDVDERADVWALGVVLYELTTGEAPFAATSLAEVCAQIVDADPQPPSRFRPELPPEFDALVLACLRRAPDARPQSVTELARALHDHVLPVCSSQSASQRSRMQPRAHTTESRGTTLSLSATICDDTAQLRPWRRRLPPLAFMAAVLCSIAVVLLWPKASELSPSPPRSRGGRHPTPAQKPTPKLRNEHPIQARSPASAARPAGAPSADPTRHVHSAKKPAPPRPRSAPSPVIVAPRAPRSPHSHSAFPDFGGRR